MRAGLEGYNRVYASDATWLPLTLLLRDADGGLLGGLQGGTYWGWLYVEIFWLAEKVRRQGYGSRMLEAAEREAIIRGCHGRTSGHDELPGAAILPAARLQRLRRHRRYAAWAHALFLEEGAVRGRCLIHDA